MMGATGSLELRLPTSIVLEFIRHVNQGDLESLVPFLTSDHILVEGRALSMKGKFRALCHWRDVFSSSPGYRIEILDLEELAESVFVVGHVYRDSGSGDRSRVPTSWYARVENGMIAEWLAFAEKEAEQPPARRVDVGLRSCMA